MKTEYRIIGAALEVLIRADNGGRFVTYAGSDYPSIQKRIEQDVRDGIIELLMPPVQGYIIEYEDIPGVHAFVNAEELQEQ